MNFWRIVRALWGIGNYWVRWAIVIIASWPLVITLAAFIGWPALTAIVALLPLLAVVIGLIGFNPWDARNQPPGNQPQWGRHRFQLHGQPLTIAAIGAAWPTFLKVLALIIGTELAFGAYLAAVPVANDRGLIPLALILFLAIAFIAMSGKVKRVMSALIAAFIVLTAVFLLGGRDGVEEKYKDAVESISRPRPPGVTRAPTPTSRTIEVDSVWVEVSIPRRHEFDVVPVERSVLIRRIDGEVFERTPDGKLLRQGEEVQDMGWPIPGYTISLRSKSGEETRVTFSAWPEKS